MGRRIVVIVVGAIVALVGLGLALGGGALMAVFGPDGTASTGHQTFSTERVALVASIDDIQDTKGIATAVGTASVRVSWTGSGKDVFIGVGPAAEVEAYLAGHPIDRVTDLEVDPFRLDTVTRGGTGSPASPGEQSFWTAHSQGPTASFTWKVTDGSYRFVVMNADASPGVNTSAALSIKVPNLFWIGLGVLIGGVLVLSLGVVLIVVGARMGTRQAPPTYAPYAGAPPR
jgi:hypothetical protein